MSDRVPLTLFTHVGAITPHASWNDPLNPSDPWNGYPYQWSVTVEIQSQSHSDPTTARPFTYNGLDVVIGDWLVFTSGAMALEIISITSQTDSSMTLIVEDVGLSNLLNNPAQTGQGIGPTSGHDIYDCLIINLNSSGVPIFAPLADYSVPINLVADITNRFQFRNYVQDYIPVSQPAHGLQVGDIIWLDTDGNYYPAISSDVNSSRRVGEVTSIDQPSVGDFTYRPLGRYVKNLPTLPGNPGQILYVSDAVPGSLTAIPPSTTAAIPVYIQITENSAIMFGGGSSGGSGGNLAIIGNSILATNDNGNIDLVPQGNGTVTVAGLGSGRLVLAGTGNSLITSGFYGYDLDNATLNVGNIAIGQSSISTTTDGAPLILGANNANVVINTTADLTGNRIVNLQDPIEDQDAATKHYVDAIAQGLSIKEAVKLSTTAAFDATFTPLVAYGSLTSNVYERLEIDTIQPGANDRILVKNQSAELENGIYKVVQIGGPSQPWILSRTTDFNGQGVAGQVSAGDFVFVTEGYQNGGTGWVQTTPNPVDVNVSPIVWTQFSTAGVIQAGFGLTKTGTILDVNVAPIINTSTGLNTSMGPLGYKIIELNIDPAAPLEVYAGALRVKTTIAGTGLSYDLGVGNISVNTDQPTITGLGNVISGTWSAGVIATQYGGTGNAIIGLPAQSLVVNDDGVGTKWEYRSKLTESDLAPYYPSPADGDRWFNTDTGIMFTRITDTNGGHWVEL